MDNGQMCIARVEGDRNKGAGEREHHADVEGQLNDN